MREAILDERVDRVPHGRSVEGGDGGTNDRLKGPVSFVFGSFGYPAMDRVLLRLAQFLGRELRGHDFGGRGGEDALDDRALVGVAGNNWGDAGFGGLEGFVADVEA